MCLYRTNSSWPSFAAYTVACLAGVCGRRNWLFTRVIFDYRQRVTLEMKARSKCQAGAGLAIPSGRSMRRTLQPRYTNHAKNERPALLDLEGLEEADLERFRVRY